MKKLFTIIAFVTSLTIFAQAPQGFNYQATVRNSAGNLLLNQIVLVKFNILQNSSTGTVVYTETQTANTDDLGHISLVVGQGTATTGTFSAINWGNGTYYLGIELNTGSGYVAMGTTQLFSVPYALYANSAGNTQALTPNLASVLSVNNGANNLQIKNLADPTDNQDAVTKSYLQSQINILQQQIVNNLTSQYPAGTIFCSSIPTQILPILSPSTGKTWMDRNLGASQAAISNLDVLAYGDLYQWGRRADGHQCRNSPITSTLSSTDQPSNGNFIICPTTPLDWRSPQNNNLWQGITGINNPCPIGYRLPTMTEFQAENVSWSSSNSLGAFNSPLKLQTAGDRSYINGSINEIGTSGSYWTSTIDSIYSRHLVFNNSLSGVFGRARGDGASIRCIKN
jgi:uncharacterized protein (TIGR02145 family)